jgi:hypothetical protein
MSMDTDTDTDPEMDTQRFGYRISGKGKKFNSIAALFSAISEVPISCFSPILFITDLGLCGLLCSVLSKRGGCLVSSDTREERT